MRFRYFSISILFTLCLVQSSCSRSKRPVAKDKVSLVHVTGTVHVDEEPASGVMIRYVPLSPIAEKRPQYVNGFTVQSDSDGAFEFKTYAKGDGVPEGEYALLFTMFSQDKAEQIRDGEYDKLGGQYSNVQRPLKTIKVVEDEDIELGVIELKSVPKKK